MQATVLTLATVCLVVLAAAPAQAAQRSDTVHVDPGQHAAIRVDFTDGPAQEVSYDIQVTQGPNIDVLVMNNANYQRYQNGDSFEYNQDWSDLDTGNTDHTFTLQEHGTWWVVIDHTNRPEDGTGPGIVGGESVTAQYTLDTKVDVQEEARGVADRIPAPGLALALGVVALAAVAARAAQAPRR